MIVNKVSAHSLQVEWRHPMDDGGEPVLGYAIEMSEGGSSWKKVSIRPITLIMYIFPILTYCCIVSSSSLSGV